MVSADLSTFLQEAEFGRKPIREVFHQLVHSIVEEISRSEALAQSLLVAFISQDAVRELMSDMLSRGRKSIAKICVLGQKFQAVTEVGDAVLRKVLMLSR